MAPPPTNDITKMKHVLSAIPPLFVGYQMEFKAKKGIHSDAKLAG